MSDLFPKSMDEFYTEMDRQHRAKGWTGYTYNSEYGRMRDRDCYYAERIVGYQRLPIKPRTDSLTGHESAVPFNFIWNRPTDKPDLAYVIAPDTRVPNYTTCLPDALELAILAGLKTIPVPSTFGRAGVQEMVDSIINQIEGED